MSTDLILNEDWSEYDDRKKRGGTDRLNFACTEDWEVDYLAEKIHRYFPQKSRAQIKASISECCKQVGAPHPRTKIVACVMQRLLAH